MTDEAADGVREHEPARPDGARRNRFVSDGSGVVATQCLSCRHWSPGTWSCSAFADPIPPEIRANEFDHREPHDDDNGVRYEPRPDVPGAYVARLGRFLDGVAPHK